MLLNERLSLYRFLRNSKQNICDVFIGSTLIVNSWRLKIFLYFTIHGFMAKNYILDSRWKLRVRKIWSVLELMVEKKTRQLVKKIGRTRAIALVLIFSTRCLVFFSTIHSNTDQIFLTLSFHLSYKEYILFCPKLSQP